MALVLAAGAPIVANPVAQAVLGVLVLVLFGVLVYAYRTRYREDWDGLLRKWSRDERDAPDEDDD